MAVQLSKYGYERREVAVVNGHREEDPGPGDLLSTWEDIFTNCSRTLLFYGEFQSSKYSYQWREVAVVNGHHDCEQNH